MTGVSLSSSMRSISRFFHFISGTTNISALSTNPVGAHTTAPRSSDLDSLPSLHTIYAFLTGLLLTLIGIKYQGSDNNLFEEHPILMMLFLIAISIYVTVLITLRSDEINDQLHSFKLVVCHIFGTAACELLVLVLVSPMRWFVINVSSLIPAVVLALCYKYILKIHNSVPTQRSETQDAEQQAASDEIDLEAGGR